MRAPILNRKGEFPSDGWYQIEVAGEHPAGKNRRQVIDDIAMTSIVNRFKEEKEEAGENFGGMLVDPDHLSHDLSNPTAALSWLQDMKIHNGQLWGKLDHSDEGEAAIKGKRYKWFSTEYDPEDLQDLGNGRVRPMRLAGLAFTNRPNNRGAKPISNRTGNDPSGQKHNENETTMKSIAEKLGLPADADEAAILNAITKLQSEAKTAKDKAAEVEADVILNRFGSRVPEASKAGWRAQLITNREATEKLMEDTLPAAGAAPERIHNREAAKAPAAVGGGDNAAAEKKAAAIRNRAAEISRTENIPFNQAFGRAAAELS
jgi:hypothetical protein